MQKIVTKWQKRLHAFAEIMYDAQGIPYDFNLKTTVINFPTDGEARKAYNFLIERMMENSLKADTSPRPIIELEQKAFERAETNEFPDQVTLKPSESRPRLTKEMPYKMITEYVDRKAKKVKRSIKRKVCKCKK